MILECTTCHARFKVADEKIGPRGSKVRCGRCKSVFVVQKEVGAGPEDPFATGSAPVPDQDPFAAHAPPVPAPAMDPFAQQPTQDPFAPAAAVNAGAPPLAEHADDPLVDPFVAAASAAPAFGRQGPFASAASLPVTDLSDLARPAPAAEPPAVPSPPLAPPAAARTAPPVPPPRQVKLAGAIMPPPLPGSSGSLSLEEADHTSGPPSARGVGELDFGFSGRFDALDEPPPELEVGPMAASQPAAAPLGRPNSLLDGLPDSPSLELAVPAAAPAPAPAAATRASPARAAAEPAPAAEPQAAERSGSGRRDRHEGLRTLLLNSLSLVLLLLVSLALLAVWRQGRVDAGTFRLSSVRAVLGAGPREAGAVATTRVSNGLYDTVSGWQVLFVRGEVVSRSAAPLGPVKIRVEVSDREKVVARAEALAGAVPTAEELWNLTGPGDLEKLAAGLVARVEQVTKPGSRTPFVVMFPELPRDLSRMVFRVIAEPAPAPN